MTTAVPTKPKRLEEDGTGRNAPRVASCQREMPLKAVANLQHREQAMRGLVAIIVALLAALPALAAAADPPQLSITSLEEQPGKLALVVSALGPEGQALAGLTAANFRAEIDGVPLAVSDVYPARSAVAAASVLLLVDVSGSMAGEPIEQAKRALQEFVRGLDPADSVAIIAFDSGVSPILDFTTDRNQINQAIGRLVARGNTALYDAVMAATERIRAAPGRKFVVLLSDGEATVGLEKREQSLEAARAAGVQFITVGLGASIDRVYLGELTAASGGRFIEAASPTQLRQEYAEIASVVRNQYQVVLGVPSSVDRSVAAELTLQLNTSRGSVTVKRRLEPLPGARPPGFDLSLQGLSANQKVQQPLSLTAAAPAGVNLVAVEYLVDERSVARLTTPPFEYVLDPASLLPGPHIVTAIATDQRGRAAQTQVAFVVAAPSSGSPLWPLAAGLLALPLLAGGAVYVLQRRRRSASDLDSRVRPFARRVSEPAFAVDGWPALEVPSKPVRRAQPPRRPRGKVVLLNEELIRAGQLDAILEHELLDAPLTLGTGFLCDIRLQDEEGRIAGEEARIWVQRERLVYHKLTTLSAMATEGITSGWEFLENGEEIQIGPYRMLFQLYEQQESEPAGGREQQAEAAAPARAMPLGDLFGRLPEDTSRA